MAATQNDFLCVLRVLCGELSKKEFRDEDKKNHFRFDDRHAGHGRN